MNRSNFSNVHFGYKGVMEINMRKFMDISFTACYPWETISDATQKMINDQTSYAIVVDEDNTYQGILTATELLKKHDGKGRLNKSCVRSNR